MSAYLGAIILVEKRSIFNFKKKHFLCFLVCLSKFCLIKIKSIEKYKKIFFDKL